MKKKIKYFIVATLALILSYSFMGTPLNSIVTFAQSTVNTQNDIENIEQIDNLDLNNDDVTSIESGSQYDFECQGIVDFYEEDYSEVCPEDLIYTDSPTLEIDHSLLDEKEDIVSTQATTSQSTLYGTYGWEDEFGIIHPMRYMLIELYVDGAKHSTTYTDEDGYYRFRFSHSDTVSCCLYARSEGENVLVRKNTLAGSSYICVSETVQLTPGSSHPFYRFIPNKEVGQKAFSVAQALIMGAKYVEAMGKTPPSVTCHFPKSLDQYSSFWNVVDITLDAWCFWDIILHEYGHRLQHYYDIEDSPGGSHYINEDQISVHGKDKGIKLAWGEGWPTFFGIVVTQHFKADLIGVPRVGDTFYNSFGDHGEWSVNLETIHSRGEGCEQSIFAVLYDLYDGEGLNTESWDTVSIPEAILFNAVVNSKAKTFSSFYNYFISNYYSVNDGAIGEILSRYGFASTNLHVSSGALSYLSVPTFSWTAGGYTSNTFNEFQLAFYNAYDSLILKTTTQTGTLYTLKKVQWAQILSSSGNTFSVAVIAYQNNSPQTGGYYSSRLTCTKPILQNQTATARMNSSIRYLERPITLAAGQYYEIAVTFETAGSKIIQTFGTQDTVIEIYSESGTLLVGRSTTDDQGYGYNAFVRYYTSANTTYIIRVRLFSSVGYGKTKLAIAPAYMVRNGEADSITTYNDIYNINTYTDFTLYDYATRYYTHMVTYTPPSSGTYTISLESEFDNYLYVIDPRSSELIKLEIDYNDDFNGSNASITRNLEAGIPYLIITCQYNPSSAFENLDKGDDLILRISKN